MTRIRAGLTQNEKYNHVEMGVKQMSRSSNAEGKGFSMALKVRVRGPGKTIFRLKKGFNLGESPSSRNKQKTTTNAAADTQRSKRKQITTDRFPHVGKDKFKTKNSGRTHRGDRQPQETCREGCVGPTGTFN